MGILLPLVGLFGIAWADCPREATRESIARQLADHLLAERFDAAVEHFDPTMTRVLPPSRLEAAWRQTTRIYGPAKGIHNCRAERSGGYDIVFVTCDCEVAAIDIKVVFDSDSRITGLFFVPASLYQRPEYVDPESFTDRPATIGRGVLRLPGTFCIPKGDGPFSALVLVHGSGPQDRDETIGPNRPFRDLAEGLASQGIAVLRYEKRTRAHPLGLAFSKRLTVQEETIDDVVDAVTWLLKQPEVAHDRVYILGHSLGGFLLPRLAQACDDHQLPVAGWISLAGSTRPLDELIVEQTQYLAELDGIVDQEEQSALERLKQQIDRARSQDLAPDTPTNDLPLGIPASYWLDLRGYDPAHEARAISQRMLFLQGERDYQVTRADFEGWQRALRDRKDCQFRLYPGLNHLFIKGTGPSQPAEYLQAGNIASEVIADLARWIDAKP